MECCGHTVLKAVGKAVGNTVGNAVGSMWNVAKHTVWNAWGGPVTLLGECCGVPTLCGMLWGNALGNTVGIDVRHTG